MKRCLHRDKRRDRERERDERETKTKALLSTPSRVELERDISDRGEYACDRQPDAVRELGFVEVPRGDFQPRGCARDERGVCFGRECIEYTERGVLFVGMRETA